MCNDYNSKDALRTLHFSMCTRMDRALCFRAGTGELGLQLLLRSDFLESAEVVLCPDLQGVAYELS